MAFIEHLKQRSLVQQEPDTLVNERLLVHVSHSSDELRARPVLAEFAERIYQDAIIRFYPSQTVIIRASVACNATTKTAHSLSNQLVEHGLSAGLTPSTAVDSSIIQQARRFLKGQHLLFDSFTASSSAAGTLFVQPLTRLYFNEKGHWQGARCDDIGYSPFMVTQIPLEDANIRHLNIFYQVLAGASPERLQLWHALTPEGLLAPFRLLSKAEIHSNDKHQFQALVQLLQSSGIITRRTQLQQWTDLVIAILHLAELTFTPISNQGARAVSRKVMAREPQRLEWIAQLLGVDLSVLEEALYCRTRLVGSDLCTVVQSLAQVEATRDAMVRSLYSVMWRWFLAQWHATIKPRNEETPLIQINLFDVVGVEQRYSGADSWSALCRLDLEERLHSLTNQLLFHQCNEWFNDNTETVQLLDRLWTAMDTQTGTSKWLGTIIYGEQQTAAWAAEGIQSLHQFTVRHYHHAVVYDTRQFVTDASETLGIDLYTLIIGSHDIAPSSHALLLEMWKDERVVGTVRHPRDAFVRVDAILRDPFQPTENLNESVPIGQKQRRKVQLLVDECGLSQSRFIHCLNKSPSPETPWNQAYVEEQVTALALETYALHAVQQRRYCLSCPVDSLQDKLGDFSSWLQTHLQQQEYIQEENIVYFSEEAWQILRKHFSTAASMDTVSATPSVAARQRIVSLLERQQNRATLLDEPDVDILSPVIMEEEPVPEPVKQEKQENLKPPKIPKKKLSKERRRWLTCTKFMTWWIPEYFLISHISNPDVRQAWREKVAICCIISLLSGFLLFCIMALPIIICPTQNTMNTEDYEKWNTNNPYDPYGTIRGNIYDLTQFTNRHSTYVSMQLYAGKDISYMFPFENSCFSSTSNSTSCSGFTSCPTCDCHAPSQVNKVFAAENPVDFGYSLDELKLWGAQNSTSWIMINNTVYNVGPIRNMPADAGDLLPITRDTIANPAYWGTDVTGRFNLNDPQQVRDIACLNEFRIGVLDQRQSVRCLIANYIVIGSTGLIVAVMSFKFLASLQLGTRPDPEDFERFVILQVPCYSEGEESLRKTIDSLAKLDYDDKRKLLFIIADGVITGGGNDRPTPRIVLDILGVDPLVDPEPLSFISIGEGMRQHNMGKVYSGLYECSGHRVPFIVIVKCGRPSEKSRPGNRGKRDSQMILMKFLNHVHFKTPMTPMELELHYQMRYVIGVDPGYYSYLLQVDADTEVLPDSLNRLVAHMDHDSNIIGICGETQIGNAEQSFVTMLQVYEYFISHHLAKAFESLFGSVTCLPGCFSMYRIKTTNKERPLIISNEIIEDYSENCVDTLHTKNLLSLGEDRYLTTLMLKYFPTMRLTFTPDAKCLTIVPDSWAVLLSQRRRWINSTVHNLWELLALPQLCGVCLVSMRFVVFLDLIATLLLPATVVYLFYLIIKSIQNQTAPTTSLILIGAAYGMQAFIFIIRRKWEHIGWMILSIFATPVFNLWLPLYAYWHMDDFTWGNTRVIKGGEGAGHGGGALGQEEFNEKDIPMRTWVEYESETFNGPSTYVPESNMKTGTFTVSRKESMRSRQSTTAQIMRTSALVLRGSPELQLQKSSSTTHLLSNQEEQEEQESPVDPQVLAQVQALVANADLSTVTRKSIREAVISRYLQLGQPVPDRAMIHRAIDETLAEL